MVGELFSLEELYEAYEDCIKNKKSSRDYLEYHLKHKKTDLIKLLDEINKQTYKVGNSYSFIAYKPKIREIFAAGFRDRIVHHLLVGKLESYFEKRFINNVFSCRKQKGALLGIKTLFKDLSKVDNNNYYLQLDLKGFFMNIDKEILFTLVKKHLTKKNFKHYKLLKFLSKEIIFNNPVKGVEKRGKMSLYKLVPKSKSLFGRPKNKGLPIGNLTSQFFANIYLNELDNYIKRILKTKYYYRYVDDFLLLGSKNELKIKFKKIETFLEEKLKLRLSENKTKFFPVNYDIDYIGYVIRAKKIILPRKRNINSMKEVLFQEKINNKEIFNHTFSSINSYLGILKQAKTYKLRKKYLSKLNTIIFTQNNGYLKISKNNKIFDILNSNKKPLKKYKEVQTKYKNFVIIIQVGCFYKTFDRQAIYLSEKLGLKLTIFNPKTKGERIMCGFHENGYEKYIGLIEKNQINTVVLKQTKDNDGKITREIFKIYDFKNDFKLPIYSNNTINEIKINYYKNTLNKPNKPKKTLTLKKTNNIDITQKFISNFKETDFSKKSYYELIEYILHWKKFLT